MVILCRRASASMLTGHVFLSRDPSKVQQNEGSKHIPQIKKVISKEDKERMSNIYFHLAGALSNLGRMDEALKAYKV
jgi:hypothetical protein